MYAPAIQIRRLRFKFGACDSNSAPAIQIRRQRFKFGACDSNSAPAIQIRCLRFKFGACDSKDFHLIYGSLEGNLYNLQYSSPLLRINISACSVRSWRKSSCYKYYILAFPAYIGRKLASPAHGSPQRLIIRRRERRR